MKKTIINTGIGVVASLIALFIFVRVTSKASTQGMIGEAQRGSFEITVSGIGELIAEKSFDIRGPNIARNNNFRSGIIEIKDIVPEGTIVKKGDYIATLDKSSFANTLKDEETELKADQAELENKLLDTSVVLTALRDDIKNQSFDTEKSKVDVEVSRYDPPATRRKAELEYERQLRLLEYKKRLYHLKKEQSVAETKNLERKVRRQQRVVDDYTDILDQFTVKAPDNGMVTYKRERNGTKRKEGSFINPWDPVVATLPDLSSLVSKIYVSEIEVRKVRKGQPVQLSVDAFPKNSYTGEVVSIANIGEVLPNSDSKVFEVLVQINQDDPLLRPSMTTSNRIITRTYNDVIFVPIESVHAEADNIPFVYTKNGYKQVVVPGEANDKYIIIEKGLEAGTEVYLVQPGNAEKFKLAGNELIPDLKERQLARNQGQSPDDDLSIETN
jgi:multidrug efflux pump subunit AcrA (membrane-fusion protein)